MKIKLFLLDLGFYMLGSVIYSVGVLGFLASNEISPGGVTGIATVLNFLTDFPIGMAVFLINIPLLALGFVKFGKGFILKTAIATVCTSVALDFFEPFFPKMQVDLILASVFGGSLVGLGISIVMLRGSTTGGVDIVAKLINSRYPHLSIGRIMLVADAFVILLTAIVYKNTGSALYSIVALYSSSKIMDLVLYGADKGKIVYIISDKTQDIVSDILTVIKRGVTIIDVKGGFMGEKRQMIMCVLRRNEVHSVYKYVHKADKNAFIVVAEAGEILGRGFKK